MFRNEDPTSIPAVGTEPKPAIGPLIVTIPGVIKQLQPLKPNKASGSDEIPPWFLREPCACTPVYKGKRSNPAQVTSGVPQGAVLGPLLFLLYVNDLPNNLKSSIRLFADDALLYGIVSSEVDGDQLQEDLKKLEVWQNKWQMSFNPAKCKTICLSTKKVPPQRKYVFCGVELEQVVSTSYLGVILTTNLKW